LLVLAGIVFLPQVIRAQSQEEGTPKKDKAAETAKPAKAEKAKPAKEEEAKPQEPAPKEPATQNTRKTYETGNGTFTYGRSVETEKKKTADGEIETQRVRAPSYGGDNRVMMEREVKTRKLPDGTIEKEYVLKNPDGSDRMVPTEVIREKIRTDGKTTTIDREVLRPNYDGNWQPTRKERMTETGPESSRQTVKEVREQNETGDWKVVDREVKTEKSAERSKESRSVRQVPDASGRLADYEVRQEHTAKEGDKEITEISVHRRDPQDTDHPKFFLVERTKTEQTKSADGRTTKKSTTESDLLDGGATHNATAGAPKVTGEKVEEDVTSPDGSSRKTVTVKERGVATREMSSPSQIVQETDKNGNVRQIFIPAR
jgi:hypothetical protein